MEYKNKTEKNKNGVIIEDLSHIIQNLLHQTTNVTVINLSDKNIGSINENVRFPPRLIELNISHNQLRDVPTAVLNLEYLKVLNISSNAINFFDSTPKFCQAIEQLDLSNNRLERPPYWIFSNTLENLRELNLSNNSEITKTLDDDIIKEFLKFNVLVTELHIFNCRLNKCMLLLQSFSKMKTLCLGTTEYRHLSANSVIEVPCPGLDRCCDIEKLNLCNTNVYTVTPDILLYKYIKELDLSQNNLISLPDELCMLTNLEICILSQNKLLYLPDNMYKLGKLKVLHLDTNELCMMFVNLNQLHDLRCLDLYDNQLCELPELINVNLEELDLASNYFDEPEDQEYLVKKEKLRCNTVRVDGRKPETIKPESEYSDTTTDDEELISAMSRAINDFPELENRPSSSPEDWDSDDYWIPLYDNNVPPPLSPWHYFVKQKMEEGNFCPIDLHTVPVADKVKYERLSYPREVYESDGQFDDYSDDDT